MEEPGSLVLAIGGSPQQLDPQRSGILARIPHLCPVYTFGIITAHGLLQLHPILAIFISHYLLYRVNGQPLIRPQDAGFLFLCFCTEQMCMYDVLLNSPGL